ncbi:hypothetical protein K488DRAFT_88698 [Vararia minispora EC-137]|uniref:Uncharacterized protein n=1 Tax=Vararia minispora EC-137 TaxID=1314806 RepID=A0ACB8QDU5_9AGAM|nr:hypothetical protein K488DRAFT_88698 [Vararia minispora EC-137]
MSSTRQNASVIANKKRKMKRERTVTTLTGSDNLLDNGHGRDRAGPSLSYHGSADDLTSPSGGFPGFPSMQTELGGSFGLPPFSHGPTQQPIIHHPQQTTFFPSPSLPAGQADLDALQRLKDVIKNGQHEIFRAIPQPTVLANLYKGSVDLASLSLDAPSDKAVSPRAGQKPGPTATANSPAQHTQPQALALASTAPAVLSGSSLVSAVAPNDSEIGEPNHAQQTPTSPPSTNFSSQAVVSHQSPPATLRKIEEPLAIKPDVGALESQAEQIPPPASEAAPSSAPDTRPVTGTIPQPAGSTADMIPRVEQLGNDPPAERRRESPRSIYPSPPPHLMNDLGTGTAIGAVNVEVTTTDSVLVKSQISVPATSQTGDQRLKAEFFNRPEDGNPVMTLLVQKHPIQMFAPTGGTLRSLHSLPHSTPIHSTPLSTRSVPVSPSRNIAPANTQPASSPRLTTLSADRPPARVPTLQERISGAPPLLSRPADAPRALPPRVAAIEDRLSSRAADNRPRTISGPDGRQNEDAPRARPAEVPRPNPAPERPVHIFDRDDRRMLPSSATRDRFPPASDDRPRIPSGSYPRPPISPRSLPSAKVHTPVLSPARAPPPEYRSSGPPAPRDRSLDRRGYYDRPPAADGARAVAEPHHPPTTSADLYRSTPRLEGERRASPRGPSPVRNEHVYRAESIRPRDEPERESARDWYARGYDERSRVVPPQLPSSASYWDDKDRRLSSSSQTTQPPRSAASWDREPYNVGAPPYSAGNTGGFDDHDRDRDRDTDLDRGRERERDRGRERAPPPLLPPVSRDPYYPPSLVGFDPRPPVPPPARDPYPPSYPPYDDRPRVRPRSRSPVDDRPPFKRARDDVYDAPPYYMREKEPLPTVPSVHAERATYECEYYPPFGADRRTPPAPFRR